MTEIIYQYSTILGHTYLLGATEKGLAFVGSQDKDLSELEQFYPQSTLKPSVLNTCYAKQLAEYLSGQRKQFDLPLDIVGTAFQKQVWQALKQIPYGQTTSYLQIAQMINRAKASRAVGTAVGKNPVLMVIPCHRVVTSAGSLGGYRGGLAMKQALLDLEQK